MHEADEANLTWAGRRLLKPRYLDELPQIWNVFRGDMSLVGPRPWPPAMVANQVAKGFTYRNEFVAGWTGPAQVEKGVTESAGYAQLDVAYVDRCRRARRLAVVRNDLAILRRTVVVMVQGRRARVLTHARSVALGLAEGTGSSCATMNLRCSITILCGTRG